MTDDSTQAGWRPALALFVLYLLLGTFSWSLARTDAESVAIWLGAGVLFAFFMRRRTSVPVLLAGWLAATVWGMAAHALHWAPALAFGLIEAGSAWLGARILALGSSAPPLSMRSTARLVAGAVVASALGATLAAQFWIWQQPQAQWLREWTVWAFSTLAGIVLLVPVVLAYRGFQPRRSGGMTRLQFGLGLAAFAVFALLAWNVFSSHVARLGTAAATLAYLPMPFLLAASMLWGPRGGSLAMLAGGLFVIARSAGGGGPFAVADQFAGESVIEAQAFVVLWALLVLFGRGLEDGRRRALASAQEWRLRYERTLQATATLSVEFDALDGTATWSPGAARLLGDGVAQLQTMDDWLARIDDASRPLAEATWRRARAGDGVPADSYQVRLGGRSLAVQASLAPVRGPDGTVEEVAALVRLLDPAQGLSFAEDAGRHV